MSTCAHISVVYVLVYGVCLYAWLCVCGCRRMCACLLSESAQQNELIKFFPNFALSLYVSFSPFVYISLCLFFFLSYMCRGTNHHRLALSLKRASKQLSQHPSELALTLGNLAEVHSHTRTPHTTHAHAYAHTYTYTHTYSLTLVLTHGQVCARRGKFSEADRLYDEAYNMR